MKTSFVLPLLLLVAASHGTRIEAAIRKTAGYQDHAVREQGGRVAYSGHGHVASHCECAGRLGQHCCVPGSVAGLLQINLRVPADAITTGDRVPFLMIIGSHWEVYQVSVALQ